MPGTAVITGGARRIGAALARHLHEIGFDIALHYRSSGAEADALAGELCARRPQSARTFAADLESLEDITGMAREVLDWRGRIDLLVNNASGFAPTPFGEVTPAGFDAMLGSNLRGPYFLIQALLPGLGEGSSIVNIIDVHVERPLRGYSAYIAAKAGLAALTRSLALELAPAVRVNGVAPGAILWPEDFDAYDEAARRDTVAATPLCRMGDPGDIARTVAFLACEAPFITGQIIDVDGGRGLVG